MLKRFFQIECDGCQVKCGGIFDDHDKAKALAERLHWRTVIRSGSIRHFCPSHPEEAR